MLKALLVDLDGTLVDTLGDFMATLTATLADEGLPAPSRAFVAHTIGRGTEHLLQQVWLEAGQPLIHADDLAVVRARYVAHYTRLNAEASQPMPGALAFLRQAQARGLPVACVTNKPTALALQLLRRMDMAACLAWVQGAEAGLPSKPHPAALWRACEALGVMPGDTWMVGDSRNDAQAAEAAGCAGCVLVAGGYNHGEALPQGSQVVCVDTLADAWAGWG